MTQEASLIRRALTAVVLAAGLFAVVVVQLTVVNRLPLPGAPTGGSTGPDLVLLLVTAIAVTTGPVTGALTGFAGGLALDIAPPAAHYAGQYALVFCLVGYAAARVVRTIWNTTGEHDPVTVFTVMAVAAAAGEAGKAALGMLLSDPDVTSAAVSRVLPGAILYDLLLSPLVFLLVVRVTRGAVGWNAASWSTGPERAPATEFGPAQQVAGVFRQASAGAAPNLRLAGSGANYRSPSQPRQVPKLRLSGAPGGSSLRTSAASSGGAPSSPVGARVPKLNFAGDLPARPARRPAHTPGKNWLRTAATASAARTPALKPAGAKSPTFKSPGRPAAKRPARTPGRGWLRSAGTGRPAARRTGGPPHGFMRNAGAAGSPLAARPARSAAEALAARSAPSGLSALSGAGTPLARRHSPSRGWLRGSGSAPSAHSRQRRSPRSGWLGSAGRPRTVIGSGVGRGSGAFRPRTLRGGAFHGRRAARGNWYAASPSGAWLRRGRHPWRRRSQRLMRLVRVRR